MNSQIKVRTKWPHYPTILLLVSSCIQKNSRQVLKTCTIVYIPSNIIHNTKEKKQSELVSWERRNKDTKKKNVFENTSFITLVKNLQRTLEVNQFENYVPSQWANPPGSFFHQLSHLWTSFHNWPRTFPRANIQSITTSPKCRLIPIGPEQHWKCQPQAPLPKQINFLRMGSEDFTKVHLPPSVTCSQTWEQLSSLEEGVQSANLTQGIEFPPGYT